MLFPRGSRHAGRCRCADGLRSASVFDSCSFPLLPVWPREQGKLSAWNKQHPEDQPVPTGRSIAARVPAPDAPQPLKFPLVPSAEGGTRGNGNRKVNPAKCRPSRSGSKTHDAGVGRTHETWRIASARGVRLDSAQQAVTQRRPSCDVRDERRAHCSIAAQRFFPIGSKTPGGQATNAVSGGGLRRACRAVLRREAPRTSSLRQSSEPNLGFGALYNGK
jgi:hypothetical protein